jgi:uncharacterized protein (TIGR00251 family)
METLELEAHEAGVRLRVHVKPRTSRNAVLGVRGGALEVAVTAPPVEGAANEAVVEAVAAYFGVPRRRVTLLSGATSRTKRLAVEGLTPADVLERLDSA